MVSPLRGRAEDSLNRFNWAGLNAAMQTSPDRRRAMGTSSTQETSGAVSLSVTWCCCAAHLVYSQFKDTLLTQCCSQGSCAKLPIPLVYLKNMLIQQSYDWFVAQGIYLALKSGNCLPPCACVCVCACLRVSVCA